jgi:hypothetical protein
VCVSECPSMRSGERMCVCMCVYEIRTESVCECAKRVCMSVSVQA